MNAIEKLFKEKWKPGRKVTDKYFTTVVHLEDIRIALLRIAGKPSKFIDRNKLFKRMNEDSPNWIEIAQGDVEMMKRLIISDTISETLKEISLAIRRSCGE